MKTYVALLRAINVGGTGKLPMADLRALCEQCGFTDVQTVQAAGNAVFRSPKSEREVKHALEKALEVHLGKPFGVLVRTGAEMAEVLASNPFSDQPGNRTMAIFLDEAPPARLEMKGQADEQVRAGRREIYVHYPSGMGRTKLLIAAARQGTARNMNTIAKLVELTC